MKILQKYRVKYLLFSFMGMGHDSREVLIGANSFEEAISIADDYLNEISGSRYRFEIKQITLDNGDIAV